MRKNVWYITIIATFAVLVAIFVLSPQETTAVIVGQPALVNGYGVAHAFDTTQYDELNDYARFVHLRFDWDGFYFDENNPNSATNWSGFDSNVAALLTNNLVPLVGIDWKSLQQGCGDTEDKTPGFVFTPVPYAPIRRYTYPPAPTPAAPCNEGIAKKDYLVNFWNSGVVNRQVALIDALVGHVDAQGWENSLAFVVNVGMEGELQPEHDDKNPQPGDKDKTRYLVETGNYTVYINYAKQIIDAWETATRNRNMNTVKLLSISAPGTFNGDEVKELVEYAFAKDANRSVKTWGLYSAGISNGLKGAMYKYGHGHNLFDDYFIVGNGNGWETQDALRQNCETRPCYGEHGDWGTEADGDRETDRASEWSTRWRLYSALWQHLDGYGSLRSTIYLPTQPGNYNSWIADATAFFNTYAGKYYANTPNAWVVLHKDKYSGSSAPYAQDNFSFYLYQYTSEGNSIGSCYSTPTAQWWDSYVYSPPAGTWNNWRDAFRKHTAPGHCLYFRVDTQYATGILNSAVITVTVKNYQNGSFKLQYYDKNGTWVSTNPVNLGNDNTYTTTVFNLTNGIKLGDHNPPNKDWVAIDKNGSVSGTLVSKVMHFRIQNVGNVDLVIHKVEFQKVTCGNPDARYHPTLTSYTKPDGSQAILMFGGSTTQGWFLNETWEWDGMCWRKLSPTTSPPARENHAGGWYSGGQVTIFGGWDGSTVRNDTWTWNGSTWSQDTGAGPSARSGAAMLGRNNHSMLYGGNNGGTYYNDVWHYNGDWSSQGAGPSARTSPAVAYNPQDNTVMLFGGVSSGGSFLNDTWRRNSDGSWTQLKANNSVPYPYYGYMGWLSNVGFILLVSDRTYKWNSSTNNWDEIVGPYEFQPYYLNRSAIARYKDASSEYLLVFGGRESYYWPLEKTWKFYYNNANDYGWCRLEGDWDCGGSHVSLSSVIQQSYVPTPTPTPSVINTYTISAGSNDAYARNGYCTTNSAKIGWTGAHNYTGYRFTNITKPQNSYLVRAELKLTAYTESGNPPTVRFRGHDVPDNQNPTFDCAGNSPYDRRLTLTYAGSEYILDETWTDGTVFTYDVTNAVQELLSDYPNNTVITIIVEDVTSGAPGDAIWQVYPYNYEMNSSKAAQLVLYWR